MKRNPYWNTMWSDRDQEFYWSGEKFGMIFSAIMIPCAYVLTKEAVNKIKNLRFSNKEES